jgi:uncharacterized protein
MNNARKHSLSSPTCSEQSAKAEDKMEIDIAEPSKAHSPERMPRSSSAEQLQPSADSDMPDPPTTKDTAMMNDQHTADVEPDSIQQTLDSQPKNISTPSLPSLVPDPANEPPPQSGINSIPNEKPRDMHLQMPPPPHNPFAGASNLSTGTPTSTTMTQSPATMTGAPSYLSSPSVTAAVTPSPAKKKMSLSDYTKRNKAKDVEMKTERDSSPVVPPIQASEGLKEATAEAVEDDVRMS